MVREYPSTTYVPEEEDAERKKESQKVAEVGVTVWREQKQRMLQEKQSEQRELQHMLSSYSPWGKPGGGAPCNSTLRRKNVPLESYVTSKNNACQMCTHRHKNERVQNVGDDKSPKNDVFFSTPAKYQNIALVSDKDDRIHRLTGGIELVPLLTNQYTSRPQVTRFIATDATRPGYHLETLKALNIGGKNYISGLIQQIHYNRNKKMEEQGWDQERSREHFETWRSFWGRPGHGAPLNHTRRNNLHNILYQVNA